MPVRGCHATHYGMATSLRVLDAARALRDDINGFLDDPRSRALYADQLRSSAQSVVANIREGLGRMTVPDRNRFLNYAITSAEETDEHLHGNWRAKRLNERKYFAYRNRTVAVIKMLKRIVDG